MISRRPTTPVRSQARIGSRKNGERLKLIGPWIGSFGDEKMIFFSAQTSGATCSRGARLAASVEAKVVIQVSGFAVRIEAGESGGGVKPGRNGCAGGAAV